jgi:hypothetical protein
LLLREQALNRLAAQLRPPPNSLYSPIGDTAPWTALFRDQLSRAETAPRFNIAWNAAVSVADREALPIVAARLHIYALSAARQRQVVCDAHTMTGGDADWQAFRDAAMPWATLSAQAQAVLNDPAGCDTAPRAGTRGSREPPRSKPW